MAAKIGAWMAAWEVHRVRNFVNGILLGLKLRWYRQRGYEVMQIPRDSEQHTRFYDSHTESIHVSETIRYAVRYYRLQEHISEWITENCMSPVMILTRNDIEFYLIFFNPKEAVAFKIRWW